MGLPNTLGVYTDRVFSATDLNRDSRTVLDTATQCLVTITRSDQQFALMKREIAGKYLSVSTATPLLLSAFMTISMIAMGREVKLEGPLHWLKAFDQEELVDCMNEITIATREVIEGSQPASYLESVLHEWEESAKAILSEDLKAAFASPPQRESLQEPSHHELASR